MNRKVFIDGAAGTTGLEIRERLAPRADLTVMRLGDAERKDVAARKKALNDADAVILCLPDDAAREAVSLIDNPQVAVIDASTAHRTAQGWTYGFPEFLPGQYEAIARARRVSNPGCWATGFLALVTPLVRAGLIAPGAALTAQGISGYSGGGKAMIEEFEKTDSPNFVETVARGYAMQLAHKHIPEMTAHAGLKHAPVFSPYVGRFYRGMIVEVPLALWALPARPKPADLHAVLADAYKDRPFVEVASPADAAAVKTLDPELLENTNRLKLYVFGNEAAEQARLTAVLDNLGKGASGAAVQNLNLMLGLPETTGLV
jgi:N-acetyl-gamma-glutamyl-phosphate reductase